MNKELLLKTLHSFRTTTALTIQPLKVRRAKLRDFRKHLVRAKAEIYAALVAEFNRDQTDTLLAELIPLIQIIRFLERKLYSLASPVTLPGSLSTFPAKTRLHREPFGRVLVISTWNYPLLLTLEPALGAYAAGNQVILKLSPRSPHTNEVVGKLIKACFSSDEIMVIGDELSLDETLDAKYDYIFLTGNSATGKKVMAKAAENLTPCTMELGGKNPCIVAANANLRQAAKRIVWGKFFNAGQSCAAPDHILVQKEVKDKFANMLAAEIRKMYGKNPLADDTVTGMPDAAAYQRMVDLISEGRLICGGDRDPQRLTIEPTVIDRLPENSPLLTKEIFGPILPLREFATEAELLAMLKNQERPLAAYCFGGSEKLKKQLKYAFSCGALIFNDVLIHFTNMNIPFGGVGNSGFGAYHGVKTFTTFTHEKPVMEQTTWLDLPFRYPPHSRFMRRLMEFFNHLG